MTSWLSSRGACLAAGAGLMLGSVATIWFGCSTGTPSATSTSTSTPSAADRAKSQATFVQIAAVLRHPRCINCHTVTDFPRAGDTGRRHPMNVKRGPDNHGLPAMRCDSCHQDANQANGVPGAPGWVLAPLSMGWEGLDDHQLAEALKDPAKNGQRSLEKLSEHMAHDPLVAWAWSPGGTREPPPVPHDEFARLVRLWIDTGAASPEAK